MSLSTTKREFAATLHELADTRLLPAHDDRRLRAQHAGRELPVAVRVGDLGRQPRAARPAAFFYNPAPPVEFFARGVDVDVAWLGGGDDPRDRATASRRRTSRGSARSSSRKHPELTPFQLKSVLYLTANNVGGAPMSEPMPARGGRRRRARRRGGASRAARSRSSTSRARSSARAPPRSSCSTRRPTSSSSRPSRRGPGRRSSARASRRAPGSRAGCSSPASRSCSRTSPSDPRFAARRRRGDRLRPEGLMAVPLLHERAGARRAPGARPAASGRFPLAEMDLLGLFAEPGRDRARSSQAAPARERGARRERQELSGRRPGRRGARTGSKSEARIGRAAAARRRSTRCFGRNK